MKTINQRLFFSIRSGQISIKLLTKAGNQTTTLFGTKVGIRLYCTVLTLWLDLKRILPVLNFSTHSKFLYGYSWDLWFLFWMFIVSKNIHNFGYWYVNLFWWWYPALLLIPADFFLKHLIRRPPPAEMDEISRFWNTEWPAMWNVTRFKWYKKLLSNFSNTHERARVH